MQKLSLALYKTLYTNVIEKIVNHSFFQHTVKSEHFRDSIIILELKNV